MLLISSNRHFSTSLLARASNRRQQDALKVFADQTSWRRDRNLLQLDPCLPKFKDINNLNPYFVEALEANNIIQTTLIQEMAIKRGLLDS